jgi:hypothetical protein
VSFSNSGADDVLPAPFGPAITTHWGRVNDQIPGSDRLRQGSGGPPKLRAEAEDPGLHPSSQSAFQGSSTRVAPDGAAPSPPQRASVRVGDPGPGAEPTPVTRGCGRAPGGAVRRNILQGTVSDY